jgi:hypothetical protein
MLNVDKIVKTYSGRIGCMCGCLGKYSYTADGAANHGPGYDVQSSVNERSVKIIAKKVLTNPNVEYAGNIAYVEDRVKGTMKAIYFKETV